MTRPLSTLGLILALLPAAGLRGQDPALKDAFAAAKTQWAMQGDREGATARFESVLAALEPKATTLGDEWRQVLCETFNWLAVLEDRVPAKRSQATKRLDAILDLDPGFELDHSLTNARLSTAYENARSTRFAKLSVSLAPGDGQLSLDGKPLRRRATYYLNPGAHLLSYARPGFAAQDQKLDLLPKTAKALEISLTRQSSTVKVNTHPIGAEVLVDGKSIGTTRGQAPASMASYAEKLGLPLDQLSGDLVLEGLAPGRHRIEVKSPCYKPRLLELDESFATPFADHTLEPIKLESARGTLSVDSLAPGGVLSLGNQLMGPLPVKDLPTCPGVLDLRVDYPEGRFSAQVEVLEGKSSSLTAKPRPRLAFLGFEGSVPDRQRLQGLINQLKPRLTQVEFIPSVPDEHPQAALERIRSEKGAELTLLARATPGSPQIELLLSTLEGQSESTSIKPLEQDPLETLVSRFNRVPSLWIPWAGLSLVDLPNEPGPWPLQVEGDAEKAGIKPHQAITHVNGQVVSSVKAFRLALAAAQGERVTLTQGGNPYQVPLVNMAMELPLQAAQISYPLMLAELRLRYLTAKGDEAGFARMNLALAYMHFRQYAKALEALREARVGVTKGVSQGTIDYYRGLCLASLGTAYNPEAIQAFKQAAQSPGATFFEPEGPSVKQAATQALESLNP
ncbi:MAG: Serine/threonine protein kinase [Holophagaceae bacterium]|nr:Serine/threonine protein kinase [Holophagaceae bacterium]